MQDHLLLTTSQLGLLLRSARQQARLSQQDVAARLGLGQSRVSKLEADPGSLTATQLLELFTLYRLELLVREKGVSPPAAAEPAPQW